MFFRYVYVTVIFNLILHRLKFLLQNLRDPDGNQYSPFHYSLQITADGSILVVPKANSSISNPDQRKDPPPPAHKE